MSRDPKPCKNDLDCIDSEACYMGFCVNPCQLHEACASTAMCQVKMHRPICMCPKGLEGNPAINCTKPKLSKKSI